MIKTQALWSLMSRWISGWATQAYCEPGQDVITSKLIAQRYSDTENSPSKVKFSAEKAFRRQKSRTQTWTNNRTKKQKYLTIATLVIFFSIYSSPCISKSHEKGQQQDDRENNSQQHRIPYNTVIANFTSALLKFITWPTKKQELNIGIIDNKGLFASELSQVISRQYSEQKIKINILNDCVNKIQPKQLLLFDLIIVISHDKDGCIKKIINLTDKKTILIITDDCNGALKGAHIGLCLENKHLLMTVNIQSLKRSNILLSSHALKLAKIIDSPLPAYIP